MTRLLLVLSLTLACAEETASDSASDAAPAPDDTSGDVGQDDSTPGPGADVEQDVEEGSDVPPHEDAGPTACPGSVSCPCVTNEECDSGFCVTASGGGKSCAQICLGDACPEGTTCKSVQSGPDVVFLCMPDIDNLCGACTSDDECGDGNLCLPDASGQGRCGRACHSSKPCPSGFACAAVERAGDTVQQCIPEGGECPCSHLLLGVERDCATTNELGSCAGTSQCTATGWSVCDAPTPAAELCNAADDDCDGAADEDWADLGAACDVPEDGDTCANGIIACTADGLVTECAEDTPAFEQCDGIDNDCDGVIDQGEPDFDQDGDADCIDDDDDADGVPDALDCAPFDPAVGQSSEELCDGFDQNCNNIKDDGFPDLDLDSIADCVDPDIDNDQIANDDDNCPLVPNKTQKDSDGDGTGDACEDDTDGDGIPDGLDNCVAVPNTEQVNTDGDESGDACDLDDDGDSSPDTVDCAPLVAAIYPGAPEACDALDNNCNNQIDEGYADTDGDKLSNCADPDDDNDDELDPQDCAPLNAAIHSAAQESCNGLDDNCDGVIDEGALNTDQDALPDCIDLDDDGDDVSDAVDNCPLTPNPKQESSDNDGKGDACDSDDDNDGDPDTTDCAPTDATISNSVVEVCNGKDDDCDKKKDDGFPDSEADGQADCVDPDDDNDSVPDAFDNCPTIKNPDQKNSDADLLGDACDVDDDNDGAPDSIDCAPTNKLVNPFVPEACNGIDDNCLNGIDEGFTDADGDGVADCAGKDADSDGIPDQADNCPTVQNAGQQNADGDLLGDACDLDDDNDTVSDLEDCAPFDPTVSPVASEVCNGKDEDCDLVPDNGFPDTDQDAVANCVDEDDDGDGFVDAFDNCPATPNPDQKNSDSDLLGNACDSDDDNDGTPDAADCAPTNPAIAPDATEVCDGIDNDCDLSTDEGFANPDGDEQASCVDEDDDNDDIVDPLDNCPTLPNPDQKNSDSDLLGNACDNDDDNDGDLDATDCAPTNPAIGSLEIEACDGVDNDCDSQADEGFPNADGDASADCADPDDDNDQVPDGLDNCPLVANGGQQNSDSDAVGDACDADDDNDGDPDTTDCAPTNPSIGNQQDELCDGVDNDCLFGADDGFPNTDGDAQADCVDPDDDGDGAADAQDCAPLNGNVAPGKPELCGNGVDDDCDPKSVCITGKYGNTALELDPYPATKGTTSFYQYGSPSGSSSNTGLELSNRALVFLYRDPTNGNYYVVMLLDKVNDGSGGTFTMSVTGAFGASFVLSDDPGENASSAINATTGAGTLKWTWNACCTDGGVIGPLAPGSCVTLTRTASTGIDGWSTLDGTAPVTVGPITTPITLCTSP